jgi:hypothetical protein
MSGVSETGGVNRIRVKADDLVMALQTHDPETIWFLDVESGDVGNYFDGMLNGEDVDEDFDFDEWFDPDRYRVIDAIDSSESYGLMEAFIEALPEGRAKERLNYSINGRKPFRRFKDALMDFAELEQKWFAFEESAYHRLAQAWLDEEGIDAELVIPRRDPS